MIKKYLFICLVSLSALALASWGYIGHQTIARIAENHLNVQAKTAIQNLLGKESIVDVASWADEVRNDPAYQTTASWHFLNLPLGLNYTDFAKAVKGQKKENVYSAILAQEKVLKDESSTREQKVTSLKFLVHFIGDAHQPMHISRAEDKGGNTIQVQYDNKGTNLHSLWDSRLIDHEGLDYSELARKADEATPELIKQAGNADPMAWVWESYQISSKLYPEIQKSNKLGEDYYKAHILIVNDRLELAGLRLAGALNTLFKNSVVPAAADRETAIAPEVKPLQIEAKDVAVYTGKMVMVTGKAYSHSDKGSFVLVNVGAEYPNQLLTVLLRGTAKTLAENIDGKNITVTGKVIAYKGHPEIEVRDQGDITVK